MKNLAILFTFLLFASVSTVSAQCQKKCGTTCGAKAKTTCVDNNEKAEVKAYYFHATRRCATCQAVESVTKETIDKTFAEKVSFVSINREENKTNDLIKEHKISGQTLLLIKGDKVVNLTNEAFMYARTNPEKFEKKLTETLNSML